MSTRDDDLLHRASKLQRRIVFPDSSDERTVRAVQELQHLGVAIPILVTHDTPISEPHLVEYLLERRAGKGLTRSEAEHLAVQPLFRAAWMVHTGEADAGVAGSVSTTADVLRAGIWTIGMDSSVSVVSSFFLMVLPSGAVLTYADCGVVPDPTADQLADIAQSSAVSHHILTGAEPRVAFLSFSTKGSAQHPHAQKVRDAFRIFSEKYPNIVADGELQADAALVPAVAARKAPSSALAGNSNVLVFPTLDAGNIAYKLTERLAGAAAYGPVVQGLQKPFVDVSRGCTWHDMVLTAAIAALLSNSAAPGVTPSVP
ncbi:MAG: phosphate acetyltransferase [Chlorobi bacterium]|nr:phosphate acetyltransferase [Chlorobiota bacterium]MCC6331779.1 phosphate acetyltransferase [Ignavibacteria bacterium]NOG68202.1 phosphate acetyltransferase [Chlorobiota bacterium]QOJ27178.1 MAG: phosphate acetyltransferase [Ignavibacteria bacterium]WKZ78229.1 MAG: phosphate acyltransferase [Candidatus Kapabacteria bacterium]